MGGCWGRCGDADACVLFIFDLLTRAADHKLELQEEPDDGSNAESGSSNPVTKSGPR